METKLINEMLEKVHTSTVGRIIKINDGNNTCSIGILKKVIFREKEYTPPVIDNVPLLPIYSSKQFEVWVPYSVGDKVLVSFFDSSHAEALNAARITGSKRKDRFNINDCFVERSLKENINVANASTENFIIKNKISSDSFEMKTDGGVEITSEKGVTMNSNLKINGNADITGKLDVGEGLIVGTNIECKNIEAQKINVKTGITLNNVPYSHP